eukprot:TRINITY_DN5184_c0_g1_i2.p1 TRINITY_DN5184_c0_g1~~TRINITY_DN5184_c0_g1_i2.p1  ORF type:complete len:189 (+),score=29.89 TRINITY_DN5184_c0_g1_i2:201-767(+)
MKQRIARRPRPYCQILRPSIFRTSSTSKPIHNENMPVSPRFPFLRDSSTLSSNNPKVNGNKEPPCCFQLNKGIESYSCIRSNNWNIVRNSSEVNGHRSRRCARPGERAIELKNRRFASSKIVRPLAHVAKPELDFTSTPSLDLQRRPDGEKSWGKEGSTESLVKRIQLSLKEDKNSSNIRIVDSYTAL